MRLARPQGPDFDPAEAGHRMFRRDLDGVIDVLALEEIEAGNPFLRFRKRAVGDQELAFSHANRLGLADVVQAITQESASLLVVGRDPFLDVVLGGIEGLARRISTHEQQVAHGTLLYLFAIHKGVEWHWAKSTHTTWVSVFALGGAPRFRPSFPGERDVMVWCRALPNP